MTTGKPWPPLSSHFLHSCPVQPVKEDSGRTFVREVLAGCVHYRDLIKVAYRQWLLLNVADDEKGNPLGIF